MRPLVLDPGDEIVLLGAHCDDIVIGAGATVAALCRARPGLRVHALVLSGADTHREAEERAALAALTEGAQPASVTVLGLPDGRLPAHWDEAKEALEALGRRSDPAVVIGPSARDAHQDHRGLARLAPTVFRDHLVLGYEILKGDPDLAQPGVLVPVDDDDLARKLAVLHEHYPSQKGRHWFDDEAFTGLARIRGVQCHRRYAEGFHVDKLAVRVAP